MAKDDFDSLDDLDSMFSDFDNQLSNSSKNKKPISQIKEGFISGAKSTLKDKATDSYLRNEVLKEMGLKGIANTSDILDKTYQETSKLYNQAKQDLKNPLKNLVKELDSRVPENNSFLKKVLSKAKSVLGADDDLEFSSNKSQEQLDEENIKRSVDDTFGNSNNLVGEISSNARFQAQFKQTGASNALLNSINVGVMGINNYNSKLDSVYKKKSLELQYRSLLIQKKHLELTSGLLKNIVEQNKAIILNTSLPDQNKILESKSHSRHSMLRFAGKTGYTLFNNSDFITRMKTNLANKAKEYIDSAKNMAEGTTSGLEMTKGMSEMGMSPLMMLGMAAGGFLPIDSLLKYGIAPWLKGKIKPGGKLDSLNTRLHKHTIDLEASANRGLRNLANRLQPNFEDEIQGKNPLKNAAKRMLSDLLDSISTSKIDLNLYKKDKGNFLLEPATFNLRTQKSITTIIPGYLARILQQVTYQNKANPNLIHPKDGVPILDFDHDKNRFIDSKRMAGKASLSVEKVLQTQYSRYNVNKLLDKHLNTTDMSAEEKQKVVSSMLGGMFKNELLDKEYLTSDKFLKSLPPELATKFKNHINAHITDPKKEIEFLTEANNVKSNIGDIRGHIENLINQGQEEALIASGYISRTRDGYKINQNKIISNLTKGKGRDKEAKKVSPIVPVIQELNKAVSNAAKPYVNKVIQQPVVQDTLRTAQATIDKHTKTLLDKDWIQLKNEAIGIYKDVRNNPTDNESITYLKTKIHNIRNIISQKKKEYQSNPKVLGIVNYINKTINKADTYLNNLRQKYKVVDTSLSSISNTSAASKRYLGMIRAGYRPNIRRNIQEHINTIQDPAFRASLGGRFRSFINKNVESIQNNPSYIYATNSAGQYKVKAQASLNQAYNYVNLGGGARTAEAPINEEQAPKEKLDNKSKDSVLSILKKFYTKFEEYADTIHDVRVVDNSEYEYLSEKQDGSPTTKKKVYKRRGWIRRYTEKVTKPLSNIASSIKNFATNRPAQILHAIKTLLPIKTIKRMGSAAKFAATTLYSGAAMTLNGIKSAIKWINPLSLIPKVAGAGWKAARAGTHMLTHIGCSPEDLYTLQTSSKEGQNKINAEPTLTKIGFIRGDYFNANGKPIYSPCDIKGDVYNREQNIVLTKAEIKHGGLYNKYGKKVPIRGLINRMAGAIPRLGWNVAKRLGRQVLNAGGLIKSVGGAALRGVSHGISGLFHTFGIAAGLGKSGLDLLGAMLSPFKHIGSLFRDPYNKKNYSVLIEIRDLLRHKFTGHLGGINSKRSDINSVQTELNDPTEQVFADRWWRHPLKKTKAKLSQGKIYLKSLNEKRKSSGKGLFGGLGSIFGDLKGGLKDILGGGLLKFGLKDILLKSLGSLGIGALIKRGLGGALNFLKTKPMNILKALKSKIFGGGADVAEDAGTDAAVDTGVDIGADVGVGGGLEAAGAAADATGVGLPVGIALALAGGGWMLRKQIWAGMKDVGGFLGKYVDKATKAITGHKSLGSAIYHGVSDVEKGFNNFKSALEGNHSLKYYQALRSKSNVPLGIKLNNPGYIKYWPLKPNYTKVNGYVKFPTELVGLYALASSIKYYISKGYNTPIKLITKLDLPGISKHLKTIMLHISIQSRINPTAILNMNDEATLDKLITAIIIEANGDMFYSPQMVSSVAAATAKNGVPDIIKDVKIPPSIKNTVAPTMPKMIAKVNSNKSIIDNNAKAKKPQTLMQKMSSGLVGMLAGGIASIFGLSSSVFKGLGTAISGAASYIGSGATYIAGKAEKYIVSGFKDLKGDFDSVVKLVNAYGISGLTAFLESRGDPAAVSGGQGDYGGQSYGTFQLSSSPQSDGIAGFLGYIKNTPQGKYLIKSGPVDSSGFIAAWKHLANTNPQFNRMQAAYNKVNYYDPCCNYLNSHGCNLSDKKLGVHCVIDRTANQFGPQSGAQLILTALRNQDVSKLSSDKIITLIEDHKLKHMNTFFSGCSSSEREGVARELIMEKKFGIQLNGGKVSISKAAINKTPPKSNKTINIKGKINHKAIAQNTKQNIKPKGKSVTVSPKVKSSENIDLNSKALTAKSTGNPLVDKKAMITKPATTIGSFGHFNAPNLTDKNSAPVIMTTNHQDVKNIHSHVVDIHDVLAKSLEVQRKILEAMKNKENNNPASKVTDNSSGLRPGDNRVTRNPMNATNSNTGRIPTNVPNPAVNISRKSIKHTHSEDNPNW